MSYPPLHRRSFLVGCTALLAAAPLVAAPLAATAKADPADALVATLRAHRGRIQSMRVFALDARISTLVAVTPATLETFSGVRVTTHTDADSIGRVVAALTKSDPDPSKASFDARWGVVFEDAAKTRLFAVYTDRYAASGAIGGRGVIFNHPEILLAAMRKVTH